MKALLISAILITAGCKTGVDSDVKDINAESKLHFEKATLFSAPDETNRGHVFFKVCDPSGAPSRSCQADGASKPLAGGLSYQKKMPLREYEATLPAERRREILALLSAGQDISVTYPGQNQTFSDDEIELLFKPFAWPYGEGGAASKPAVAGAKCDEGYIRVPKNPEVGVSEDFCVMKYEAKKDASNRAESRASGTPWVSINRDESIKACTDANADLISNAQWQAIARNIESVGSNWSSGKVGDGSLNRGHSNGSSALAASGEENSAWSIAWSVNKRSHTLDNGEIVWDLAGNVWEWVKDNNTRKQGNNDYVSQEPWSDASGKLKWGPKGSYKQMSSGERGGLGWNSLGYSEGAVLRGGGWGSGDGAGVFDADLGDGPSDSGNGVGFRCVRPLAFDAPKGQLR